jgi:hypothetical protein
VKKLKPEAGLPDELRSSRKAGSTDPDRPADTTLEYSC